MNAALSEATGEETDMALQAGMTAAIQRTNAAAMIDTQNGAMNGVAMVTTTGAMSAATPQLRTGEPCCSRLLHLPAPGLTGSPIPPVQHSWAKKWQEDCRYSDPAVPGNPAHVKSMAEVDLHDDMQ